MKFKDFIIACCNIHAHTHINIEWVNMSTGKAADRHTFEYLSLPSCWDESTVLAFKVVDAFNIDVSLAW